MEQKQPITKEEIDSLKDGTEKYLAKLNYVRWREQQRKEDRKRHKREQKRVYRILEKLKNGVKRI